MARLGGPRRRPARGTGHPVPRPGGAGGLRRRHRRPSRRTGRRGASRPVRRVRCLHRARRPAGVEPGAPRPAHRTPTWCVPCRNRPDDAGSTSKKALPSSSPPSSAKRPARCRCSVTPSARRGCAEKAGPSRVAGYRASGGVRSAIATTAEQALAALDEDGQAVARRVLLRMVELRPEGDDTRRWASRREITDVDPQRTDDVVATLTESAPARRRPRPDHRRPRSIAARLATPQRVDRRRTRRPPRPPGAQRGHRTLGDRRPQRRRPVPRACGSTRALDLAERRAACPDRSASSSKRGDCSAIVSTPRRDDGPAGCGSSPPSPPCSPPSPSPSASSPSSNETTPTGAHGGRREQAGVADADAALPPKNSAWRPSATPPPKRRRERADRGARRSRRRRSGRPNATPRRSWPSRRSASPTPPAPGRRCWPPSPTTGRSSTPTASTGWHRAAPASSCPTASRPISSADPTGRSAPTTWTPDPRRARSPVGDSGDPHAILAALARRRSPRPGGMVQDQRADSRPPSASSTPRPAALQFPPVVIDGGVTGATFTSGRRCLAIRRSRDARLLVLRCQHRRSEWPPPRGQFPRATSSRRVSSAVGDEVLVGSAYDGTLRVFDVRRSSCDERSAATPGLVAYLRDGRRRDGHHRGQEGLARSMSPTGRRVCGSTTERTLRRLHRHRRTRPGSTAAISSAGSRSTTSQPGWSCAGSTPKTATADRSGRPAAAPS